MQKNKPKQGKLNLCLFCKNDQLTVILVITWQLVILNIGLFIRNYFITCEDTSADILEIKQFRSREFND